MKPRIVVAITHAMTWFWTQACVSALKRHLTPAITDAYDVEIVMVDNSWDNSPSIYGITKTRLGEGIRIINNHQVSFCHSAAMDIAFKQSWPMDYFIPIDNDCIILKPNWFNEFMSRLRPTDYAVGGWHHQQWVYPSFAVYRGAPLKAMADASAANKEYIYRWGDQFNQTAPFDEGHEELVSGPFSERRGWPAGTVLKETPTGQLKGPGHYEPGQQFHHWAVQAGYTYSTCPARTIRDDYRNIPLGTFYGVEQDSPMGYDESRDACWAMHMWAGTRALDMINKRGGDLNDHAIISNVDFWLEREGGWWLNQVDADVRTATLALIKQYGWTIQPRPDGRPDSEIRIKRWYQEGGVKFND
jgi:hypothetical protein